MSLDQTCLRSHLLLLWRKAGLWLPVWKNPNHIVFRLLSVPVFFFLTSSVLLICHVNRYIMLKCCLFLIFVLLCIPHRVGHLIWRLRGFWCPSTFLDFVTSGTFSPQYSFMSLPSLKVSCLFSVMTISSSGKKKKSSEKTSEQICLGLVPFLNLRLG